MWFTSLLVGALLANTVRTQGVQCPLAWMQYQNNCYKIVPYPELTYAEADSVCKNEGSALVSINNQQEHNFISDQLKIADRNRETTFWTSGSIVDPAGTTNDRRIKWEGEGIYADLDVAEFWRVPADRMDLPIHIVYQYFWTLAEYRWRKEYGDIKNGYICELPVAEIHRLVQIYRDFTFGSNITDLRLAERGPQFQIQPVNKVFTSRTRSVFLECMATGNPQPRYRWYKGRNLDEEVLHGPKVTLTNGKITFQNVSEAALNGKYQCSAENKFGIVRSNVISLTFGYLNEFSNVPREEYYVDLYQGTYVQCKPPIYKPSVTFEWQVRKRNGRYDFVFPQLNNYMFVSNDGNLYFSEVQVSDSAFYRCMTTLSNDADSVMSESQSISQISLDIFLRIQNNTVAQNPAKIHNNFPAVFPSTPLLGETIKIECLAYGRLPLIYSWSKHGDRGLPKRHRLSDLNRVLTINNVQLEDEGTYMCDVKGRNSHDLKNFTLTIGVKPYFVSPLRDMHADINSQLTWRCEAISKPRAVITWYKNGKMLNSVPGELEISSNILKIMKLDPGKHNGMYQCSAKNIHGETFTGAQLRVLGFVPKFLKSPLPQTQYASVGGNLTLPCKPEAAPTPDIQWLRNGGEITSTSGMQILSNGFLKITAMTDNGGGIFTCKAVNSYGEASSSTQVIMTQRLILSQRPVSRTANFNETVFMPCEASYDYVHTDLVYEWRLNGHKLDLNNNPAYALREFEHTLGLYIYYVTFEEAGTYECVAKTTMESVRDSVILKVKGPPGEPALVYAERGSATNSSIQITWTRPPDHNDPIRFYTIEAQNSYETTWAIVAQNVLERETIVANSDDPGKRSFLVTGLKPFNNYRFQIYAWNSYMIPGPTSLPSDYYHLLGSPPVIAPKVGGGGGTVGTLIINWPTFTPDNIGGQNLSFVLYYRKRSENDREFIKVPLKSKPMSNGMEQYVKVIDENDFYIPYEVKVQAANEHGYGPMSSTTIVYSAEGMPTFLPQNVGGYEINATAIYVSWDPVPQRRNVTKGIVQGFEINVQDIGDNGIGKIKQTTTYVYGYVTGGVAIGLNPDTDYDITVQMFNSAGETKPSIGPVIIGTYKYPPLLYPQYVTISSHGSESVAISWRGVSTGLFEESIRGYKLYVWRRGDPVYSAKEHITSKVTNTVIYGILKDTVYSLRVAGFSNGGDGKKSPTQYFTLGGRVQVDPMITEIMAGSTHASSSVVLLFLCVCVSFFRT